MSDSGVFFNTNMPFFQLINSDTSTVSREMSLPATSIFSLGDNSIV